MKTILFIGVILGITAGICVTKAFISKSSPKYTARAEYSINWNQMGVGDDDYDPQQARRNYDHQLAVLRMNAALVRELCLECDVPLSKSGLVAQHLQRYLTVRRAGSVNDHDLYQVQFADDNRKVAIKAVNLLTRRLVAVINVKSKIQDGKQTCSSFKKNEAARIKTQNLRVELAALSGEQQDDYNGDRQAGIQEVREELDPNEVTEGDSGLETFVYLVAAFSNPAEIQQRGVIVKG
jgi:hypothetical protein